MMKAWKNIPLYMKIFILLIAGCVIRVCVWREWLLCLLQWAMPISSY